MNQIRDKKYRWIRLEIINIDRLKHNSKILMEQTTPYNIDRSNHTTQLFTDEITSHKILMDQTTPYKY